MPSCWLAYYTIMRNQQELVCLLLPYLWDTEVYKLLTFINQISTVLVVDNRLNGEAVRKSWMRKCGPVVPWLMIVKQGWWWDRSPDRVCNKISTLVKSGPNATGKFQNITDQVFFDLFHVRITLPVILYWTFEANEKTSHSSRSISYSE